MWICRKLDLLKGIRGTRFYFELTNMKLAFNYVLHVSYRSSAGTNNSTNYWVVLLVI